MKFSRARSVRSAANFFAVFTHGVNLNLVAVFSGENTYSALSFRFVDAHFLERYGYVGFNRFVNPILNGFEFFGKKFSVEIKIETQPFDGYVGSFLIDIVVFQNALQRGV